MIELKKVSKAFGEKKVINALDLVKPWRSSVLLVEGKRHF